MDYRIYSAIALIFWGLWAYFSKILAYYIKTEHLAFYTTLGSFIAITLYAGFRTKIVFNEYSLWAIVVGAIATIGTFAFYAAMVRGPLTVVITVSNLYIIIPIILGVIFLKEALTFKHFLGIILALIGIVLLSF
ncbi:MAG: EamA family transporter [candidate division WOR-3 bacterium]|nr:EamA family transporter [candidate division WOR-3 bacterium]MCX7757054.1 EamA family transporter [candidate division WOR-3 bacterium]MDW7987247.1 EamA family transporter [candidate division WOR-3 bacterium]